MIHKSMSPPKKTVITKNQGEGRKRKSDGSYMQKHTGSLTTIICHIIVVIIVLAGAYFSLQFCAHPLPITDGKTLVTTAWPAHPR
jgi:hypothetical protein